VTEPYSCWGSKDRYYAGGFGAENHKQRSSDTVGAVADVLAGYDPDIQGYVERAFKQWNLIIRDYLRTEMALRLSVGDDTQAVPVRVVGGLPCPFEAVVEGNLSDIWLLLNGPRVEQTVKGLQLIEECYDQLASRPILQPSPATKEEVQHVHGYIERLAGLIQKLPFVSQIGQIDQDILGAYFFRVPRIDLYWMAIGIIAATLGVSVEALTVVVIAHELAHAYTHLGRDIDGDRWDTEAFAHAELRIVEGLAQFYAGVVCDKLDQRMPAAKLAYDGLLKLQADPYSVHRDWTQQNEAGGEIVRVSMIQARSNGEERYETFRDILEWHRQNLNRGKTARR